MNSGCKGFYEVLPVVGPRVTKLVRLYEQCISHFIVDHIHYTTLKIFNSSRLLHSKGFLYFTTHTTILHQENAVQSAHVLQKGGTQTE